MIPIASESLSRVAEMLYRERLNEALASNSQNTRADDLSILDDRAPEKASKRRNR